MITEKYLFNVILVHTARTWDRIREGQPFKEMSQDNIESVDSIVSIADRILQDKVMKDFLIKENYDNWDWDKWLEKICSDVYIEALAHKIITEEYL